MALPMKFTAFICDSDDQEVELPTADGPLPAAVFTTGDYAIDSGALSQLGTLVGRLAVYLDNTPHRYGHVKCTTPIETPQERQMMLALLDVSSKACEYAISLRSLPNLGTRVLDHYGLMYVIKSAQPTKRRVAWKLKKPRLMLSWRVSTTLRRMSSLRSRVSRSSTRS